MKRNHHEWTRRTPDGRRVFRAWIERGEWLIESAEEDGGRAGRRRCGEPGSGLAWERSDRVPLDDLRHFREVLWNKYQRGRVAYKLIERIDLVIAGRELEEPPEESEQDEELGDSGDWDSDGGDESSPVGDRDDVGERG